MSDSGQWVTVVYNVSAEGSASAPTDFVPLKHRGREDAILPADRPAAEALRQMGQTVVQLPQLMRWLCQTPL